MHRLQQLRSGQLEVYRTPTTTTTPHQQYYPTSAINYSQPSVPCQNLNQPTAPIRITFQAKNHHQRPATTSVYIIYSSVNLHHRRQRREKLKTSKTKIYILHHHQSPSSTATPGQVRTSNHQRQYAHRMPYIAHHRTPPHAARR